MTQTLPHKKRNHINIRLGFQNIINKHQIVNEEELCQNNTCIVKSTTFSPYLRNIYLNKCINSPKIMTELTNYVPLGLD